MREVTLFYKAPRAIPITSIDAEIAYFWEQLKEDRVLRAEVSKLGLNPDQLILHSWKCFIRVGIYTDEAHFSPEAHALILMLTPLLANELIVQLRPVGKLLVKNLLIKWLEERLELTPVKRSQDSRKRVSPKLKDSQP